MYRCLPITWSNTKRPITLPPACAFQARPACISTNWLADGKASFCASGMVRYCTACAADVSDTTAAAGAVHFIHSGIASPPSLDCESSEEESNPAKHRVRIRAGRILADRLLIGALEHELGRGEDRNAHVVELQLSG